MMGFLAPRVQSARRNFHNIVVRHCGFHRFHFERCCKYWTLVCNNSIGFTLYKRHDRRQKMSLISEVSSSSIASGIAVEAFSFVSDHGLADDVFMQYVQHRLLHEVFQHRKNSPSGVLIQPENIFELFFDELRQLIGYQRLPGGFDLGMSL